MVPEWSSRKTSVASVSCGVVSIRGRFIAFDGQEHAAGGARLRNHGGFDHLHRRRPLHGAGVLPGVSAFSPLARMIIRLVLVLRGSVPLGCGPGNRSSSGYGVTDRHTGDSGIFGPSLAVRIVAQRAGDETQLVAVTTTSGIVG